MKKKMNVEILNSNELNNYWLNHKSLCPFEIITLL